MAKYSANKGIFLGKTEGGFTGGISKGKKAKASKGYKITGMRQIGEALGKKKNYKPNVSI